MGFVSTRLAPRKRPCTNIIVYQCWAIVGLASVTGVPAFCQIRLQRQGCHYPLAFSTSLAWPQALLSLISNCYNDPPGDWPPDSPQEAPPGLSRVRSVEAGGWRAQCWCGGQSRVVDSRTWPWLAPLRWGQAWSSQERGLLQRTGDERLFSVHEPGAVSGSALTAGDRTGQPGQAPAAGHRSESESSRTH